MKLFYSYMWRLFAHISTLSKVVRIPFKIFSPANQWHRLVMPGRCLFLVFCFTLFSLKDARPQSPEKSGAVSDKASKLQQSYNQKAGKHLSTPFHDYSEIERVNSNPLNDLSQYPMMRYEVDTSLICPLQIGDKIPVELLNMPLRVVGKNTISDTIALKDLSKDKILVLDFWASWCAPCIQSMEKLENFTDSLKGDLVLLGIHIDYDYKAYPFINKRNWDSLSAIGLNAYVLNRSFFDRKVVSRAVWIKDGRILAITGNRGFDLQMIKDIISGKPSRITNSYDWTYSFSN
ncbi:TlpA family protein disulfide reductase [Sphingobacterium kyonggiense]|nr:TlpA family protein disulfide reductase [Sphingobacterium mizutaii]